jgi:hypothetical protein
MPCQQQKQIGMAALWRQALAEEKDIFIGG